MHVCLLLAFSLFFSKISQRSFPPQVIIHPKKIFYPIHPKKILYPIYWCHKNLGRFVPTKQEKIELIFLSRPWNIYQHYMRTSCTKYILQLTYKGCRNVRDIRFSPHQLLAYILNHGTYKWIIILEKCFSHQMNYQQPWKLKKSKPWVPFWSYQLDSSANPQKWAKWDELAVLFRKTAIRILIFAIAMGSKP